MFKTLIRSGEAGLGPAADLTWYLSRNNNAILYRDRASYQLSSLEDGMTESCLCGSITVNVTQKSLFTKPNGHICHCMNCRKITGASAATLLLLPSENVTLNDPRGCLKTYMDHDAGSGKPLPRSLCSNCGSAIGELHPDKKKSWLNLGIFPSMPQPEFEIFTAHRQAWLSPVEGAKQYQFVEEMDKYR